MNKTWLAMGVVAAGAVGILGSSTVSRSQGQRMRRDYSELGQVLAVQHLKGGDIEPFRVALKRIQALFESGQRAAANAMVSELTARARALSTSGGKPREGGTLAARAFEPSDFHHEAAVHIPFYERSETEFRIKDTYYVSQDAAGASNDNDGRAATFESGTRGPFKDFNSLRVRSKLVGASEGVRVIVDDGVYVIENLGDGGVLLDGRGDELHPTILEGAPGARAVIVPSASLDTKEQVLVAGRHAIVQNLFFKRITNKYNLLVIGDETIIRHNVFEGPWMEDSIKIGAEARHCLVFDNDISDHGSQGVDSFGNDILIKDNRVHHSSFDRGMGFRTKGGTRNHVYVGNVLHDLSRGLGGGGTGDLEIFARDDDGGLRHAAFAVKMVGNTLYNIDGIVVDFQSCKDCSFESNRVFDSKGGYQVGIDPDVLSGPYRDLAAGLPSSEGIVVKNNSFANLTSGFVGMVEHHAERAFASNGNSYFMDVTPIFAYRDRHGKFRKLQHAQFRETLDTDHSSSVKPLRDAER